MTALLTLAKYLGIDPGPLNQADLQEQTCSAAMTQIIELAAQLERLRGEITAIMGDSSGVAGYHLNGEIARWGEFSDLEEILSETTPAALAALKAKWQAEAIEQSVKLCRRKVFDGPDLYSDAVLHYASELRQRALESGNANPNNPPA